MDGALRRSMFAYYDRRAPEYEEVYTFGTGSASITDPDVFRAELPTLAELVERLAGGRLIDIGCGSGYWLPRYAPRCTGITLFDQSARMLEECRTKAADLGITDRCVFQRGDLTESEFVSDSYDFALVAFVLSHLTESQEISLFDRLRSLLTESGQFLILDSAWSALRAQFNDKVGRQTRHVNDGTRFEIFKRYCDLDDIGRWPATHGVATRVEHFGPAFYAVSGSFIAETAEAK